jgi:hypothetical protein
MIHKRQENGKAQKKDYAYGKRPDNQRHTFFIGKSVTKPHSRIYAKQICIGRFRDVMIVRLT